MAMAATEAAIIRARSASRHRPACKDVGGTIFRVASMVKLLTSVAAFSWSSRASSGWTGGSRSDSVATGALGFDFNGVPNCPARTVTLRNLLTHTSASAIRCGIPTPSGTSRPRVAMRHYRARC